MGDQHRSDESRLAHPWLVAAVEQVEYEGHNDRGPNAFIQWKGTDVCLDFWCECGAQGHFDGYFAYALRCPACGSVWAMPATIYPRKLTDAEVAAWPSAGPVDLDVDEPDIDRSPIEDLIERSSLGSPGAKALRDRTPPEVVDRILRKARQRVKHEASVALDQAIGRYLNDAEFHAEVYVAVRVMEQVYPSLFELSDLERFVTQAAAVALNLSHYGPPNIASSTCGKPVWGGRYSCVLPEGHEHHEGPAFGSREGGR